ncbi:restriction endonuclease subunit S [Macrococcus capreoli]
MEFKKVKLRDIANINMGQSPKSEFYNDIAGTPFLQGNRTFGFMYPKFDTYTSKITKLAGKGDILFSVRAPVGDINIAPSELCIGRGLSAISSKNDNNEFLYYLLKNMKNIENFTSGTIFSSINKKTLENLEFYIPNNQTQRKIGKILRNIDEKIELNNKTIDNLEQISQTLFKRWFIDFEFTNEDGKPYKSSGGEMVKSELGEIPKGWEINRISSILNINSGYAFKSAWWSDEGYKVVKIKDIENNTINMRNLNMIKDEHTLKAESFKIIGGEILIALTGATAGKLGIVPKLDNYAYVNQRVGLISSNYHNSFIYNLLLTNQMAKLIKEHAIGSAQPNISPVKLSETKIIKPLDGIIEKYNTYTQGNYQYITEIFAQNYKLEQLRDTLLPKLLSGEIEIPEDLEV